MPTTTEPAASDPEGLLVRQHAPRCFEVSAPESRVLLDYAPDAATLLHFLPLARAGAGPLVRRAGRWLMQSEAKLAPPAPDDQLDPARIDEPLYRLTDSGYTPLDAEAHAAIVAGEIRALGDFACSAGFLATDERG